VGLQLLYRLRRKIGERENEKGGMEKEEI